MKHRRNERGVALIICLFALMLLSGIGLGMMYMADTETSINGNYRDSQNAYFAAVAGLQEVRERLMPSSTTRLNPPPTTLPTTSANTGVVYIINSSNSVPASSIQPWTSGNLYEDSELCHENFGGLGLTNTGPNTPCGAVPTGTYYTWVNSNSPLLGSDANLAYRWVRVTQKSNKSAVPDLAITPGFYVSGSGATNNSPICWDGTKQTINASVPSVYANCEAVPSVTGLTTVYLLTSLAVTPAGSRRMAQMEVANDPPLITNAALDSDDVVIVQGSSVTVNGYDNCKCSCVVGTGGHPPTCTPRYAGVSCNGATGPPYAIYSAGDININGGPALVPATLQDVSPFPYDQPFIQSLIDKYSSQPGTVRLTNCSGNNCGTFSGAIGTPPTNFPNFDPTATPIPGLVNQTTYVPGNFDLQSQASGAGVLVVDGNLTIHGGFQFYGLIIVKGVLTFQGGGQGQGGGNSSGTNVIGSIIAGQSSVDNTNVAGGVNIQYDRCALLNNQVPAPPRVLSTHELSY